MRLWHVSLFVLLSLLWLGVGVPDATLAAPIVLTNNTGISQSFVRGPVPLSTQTLVDGGFIDSGLLDIEVHANDGNDAPFTLSPKDTALEACSLSDGGSFTGDTTDCNDDGAGDIELLPATPAINDAMYFAAHWQFRILRIEISTAGAASITPWAVAWEYCSDNGGVPNDSCDVWLSLPNVSDNTDAFRTVGTQTVTWDVPFGMVESQEDGTQSYWVRARITDAGSGAYTQPLGTQVFYDPAMFWLFGCSDCSAPTADVMINGESLGYTLFLGSDDRPHQKYFPGEDGVTTPDNADLEPGSDFDITLTGYLNTDTLPSDAGDDFEDNDLSISPVWDNTTDFESTTVVASEGTYSMRFKTDRFALATTEIDLGNATTSPPTLVRFSIQVSNDSATTTAQVILRDDDTSANGPNIRLVGDGSGGATLQFFDGSWMNIEASLSVDTWYRVDIYDVDYSGTCTFNLARDGTPAGGNPFNCATNVTSTDVLRFVSASDVNAEFGAIDEILFQDRASNIVYKPQALQVWVSRTNSLSAEVWDGSSISNLDLANISSSNTTVTLQGDGSSILLIEGVSSASVTAVTISDNANIWNWAEEESFTYIESIEIQFSEIDVTDSQADWNAGTLANTEAQAGQPPTDVDFTYYVEAAGDDGFWREGASSFFNTVVRFGYDTTSSANETNAFVRFDNVLLTQGQEIQQAFLTFVGGATTSNNTVNVVFSAIDEDDANAPTTFAGAEAVTRTTATVDWDAVPTFTANTDINTPDITTVIQEIVNRAGWSSGNAIVIYIEDNGSDVAVNRTRSAFDFNQVITSAVDTNSSRLTVIPTGAISIADDFSQLEREGLTTASADDPIGWEKGGNTLDGQITQDGQRSGDYGALIEWSGTSTSFGTLDQEITAAPGEIWSASAWARRFDPFDGELWIRFEWLNSGGGIISTVDSAVSNSADWTILLHENQTAPALTTQLRIILYADCDKSTCSSPTGSHWDRIMLAEAATAPTFPNASNVLVNPSFEDIYLASGTWISPTIVLSTVTNVVSTAVTWSAIAPSNTTLTVESSIDSQASWQSVAASGDSISGISAGDDISSTNINIRFTFASSDQAHSHQIGTLIVSALDATLDELRYGLIDSALVLLDLSGNAHNGTPSFPLLTTNLFTIVSPFSALGIPTIETTQEHRGTADTVGDLGFTDQSISSSTYGFAFWNAIATSAGIPLGFIYIPLMVFAVLIVFMLVLMRTKNMMQAVIAAGAVLVLFVVWGVADRWVLIFYALGAALAMTFTRGSDVLTQ